MIHDHISLEECRHPKPNTVVLGARIHGPDIEPGVSLPLQGYFSPICAPHPWNFGRKVGHPHKGAPPVLS
jgi:hypothetical protein